jgi:hypothetical protein
LRVHCSRTRFICRMWQAGRHTLPSPLISLSLSALSLTSLSVMYSHYQYSVILCSHTQQRKVSRRMHDLAANTRASSSLTQVLDCAASMQYYTVSLTSEHRMCWITWLALRWLCSRLRWQPCLLRVSCTIHRPLPKLHHPANHQASK